MTREMIERMNSEYDRTIGRLPQAGDAVRVNGTSGGYAGRSGVIIALIGSGCQPVVRIDGTEETCRPDAVTLVDAALESMRRRS